MSMVNKEPYITPEMIAKWDAGDVYVNNETVCGSWGGMTLYRRVFQINTLPNTTTTEYDVGISQENITVRRIYGTATSTSDNVVCPLPYLSPSANSTISLYWSLASKKIGIGTARDRSSYSARVILEYTKN